jgi:hypothetical protein
MRPQKQFLSLSRDLMLDAPLSFSPTPTSQYLNTQDFIRESQLSDCSARSEDSSTQPKNWFPQETILNMTRLERPKAELSQPKLRKTSPASVRSTSTRLKERGRVIELESKLADSQVALQVLQSKYNLLETKHARLDLEYQEKMRSSDATERVDSLADVKELLGTLVEDVQTMKDRMGTLAVISSMQSGRLYSPGLCGLRTI